MSFLYFYFYSFWLWFWSVLMVLDQPLRLRYSSIFSSPMGVPLLLLPYPPILYLWEARTPIFRIHLGVLFSTVKRHDRLAKSLCDNIAMMLRCSNFPFGICCGHRAFFPCTTTRYYYLSTECPISHSRTMILKMNQRLNHWTPHSLTLTMVIH
jgi:hypothetical protein